MLKTLFEEKLVKMNNFDSRKITTVKNKKGVVS